MPVFARANYVPGDGPTPARVAVFGGAPDPTENRTCRPFDDTSGYWLDLFLGPWGMGSSREDCYVSNVVKWYPGRGPDKKILKPDSTDLARDQDDLLLELEDADPDLIVACGEVAVRALTGIAHPMTVCHGQMYKSVVGRQRPVLAAYHPADGLYSPPEMGKCLWDFRRAGQILRGEYTHWRLRGEYTYWRRSPTMPTDYRIFSAAMIPEYERNYPGPIPIGFDTEGRPSDPWSLQWSPAPGIAYVIHYPVDPGIVEWFQSYVIQRADPLVIHSSVWDMRMQEALGIDLSGIPVFDTQTAGYLTNVEDMRRGVGLKPTALRWLGVEMLEYEDVVGTVVEERAAQTLMNLVDTGITYLDPELKKDGTPKKRQKLVAMTPLAKRCAKALEGADDSTTKSTHLSRLKLIARDFPEVRIPTATLDDVPEDLFLAYAGADPDCTRALYFPFEDELRRMGLKDVLELDQRSTPLYSRMNHVGLMCNVEGMERLRVKYEKQAEEHAKKLRRIAGDSGWQPNTHTIRWLLYDKLRMHPPARTPTGLASTDEEAIAQLAEEYTSGAKGDALQAILAWRESRKHVDTYITPVVGGYNTQGRQVPSAVRRDGSVSPDLRLVNTATGRPAGLFVTFPAHTEDGAAIREQFYARPGCVFTSTDLSQIELRVAAHVYEEQAMIGAFRQGLDLHRLSAAGFYKVGYDAVTKMQRTPQKATNFAMIYLVTPKGLNKRLALPPPTGANLHMSIEETEALIEWWYGQYPGIRPGQHRVITEAREEGFVRGLSGRLRYMPMLRSEDEYKRGEAERETVNHPIQEGGAMLARRASAILHEEYIPEWRAMGIYVEPMLWIHDELMFEVEEDWAWEWSSCVEEAMVRAGENLLVPIGCESHVGSTWREVKG